MRILRSVVAIVVGFWFMAAAARVGTLIAARVLLPGDPNSGAVPSGRLTAYLLALLVVSAVGALMGGWLAARLAPFAPFRHACVLAAICAAMSIPLLINAPNNSGLWWYAIATGIINAAGVLLGGKLREAAAAAGGPVVA
jgi:hypothetical protein